MKIWVNPGKNRETQKPDKGSEIMIIIFDKLTINYVKKYGSNHWSLKIWEVSSKKKRKNIILIIFQWYTMPKVSNINYMPCRLKSMHYASMSSSGKKKC